MERGILLKGKTPELTTAQVGPAFFESTQIEIGLYPKCSQNHTPSSYVFVYLLNSKFSKFEGNFTLCLF